MPRYRRRIQEDSPFWQPGRMGNRRGLYPTTGWLSQGTPHRKIMEAALRRRLAQQKRDAGRWGRH